MNLSDSSDAGYRIDIGAAVAGAYRTVLDNVRIAGDLAILPFFKAAELAVGLAGLAVVTALVSETYRRLAGPAPGGIATAAQ